MIELILLPLLALAALSALTLYCCCVAAGRADRRMEELERQREEADGNDLD